MNPLKNFQQKYIIVMIALALSVGAGAGFVLYPLANSIGSAAGEIREIREEIERQEVEQRNILAFQRFLRERGGELRELHHLFINAETPVEFIEFLELVGRQIGIQFSIDPRAVERREGDSWGVMQFSLGGEGEFEQVARLLQKLESAPYLVFLEQVTIQQQQDPTPAALQAGSEFVNFSIRLNVLAQ